MTVAEQRVSASRVVWAQMALSSLMDSAVLELFQWSSMPSSQTTFCLWASMDDLVASSSSRALLAFSQIWPTSAGGVILLDLGVVAMGEMVVGTPSRKAQHHPGHSPGMKCPLAWRDPSACGVEM